MGADDGHGRGWVMVGFMLALSVLSYVGSGVAVAQWVQLALVRPPPAGLGWSQAFAGSLYGSAAFAAGTTTVGFGWAVDRIGSTKSTCLCSALLVLACLAGSAAPAPQADGSGATAAAVVVWLVCFVFAGCRNSFVQLIPRKLISYWFWRRRGRAFAYIQCGSFVGGAVAPYVNVFLIETLGWRAAWQCWAAAIAAFGLSSAVFLRDEPTSLPACEQPRAGKRVDEEGEERQPILSERPPEAGAAMELEEPSLTLRHALGTKALWALLVLVFCRNVVIDGVEFHLLAICSEAGMGVLEATTVVAAVSLAAAAGNFVSGFIAERGERALNLMVVWGVLATAASLLVLLLMLATGGSLAVGLAFAVVLGSAETQYASQTLLLPAWFGKEHIGSISGVYFSLRLVGMAVGPALVGVVREELGSYTVALELLLIAPAVAVLSSLFARRPT